MTRCKLVLKADGDLVDTFAATHAGFLTAQRAAERRARSLSRETTAVILLCPGKAAELLVRCTPKRCSSGTSLALDGSGRRSRRRPSRRR